MTTRTRIAPSPTGYPHIGTIYQALFDYAFAKRHNGQFIVRIEDTDQTRLVEDAEEKIYQAMDWFSLTEDESPRKSGKYKPYKQSERLEIYQEYAYQLIQKGHAYYCFCTKERLEEMRKQQAEKKQIIKYDKFCLSLSSETIEKNLAEKKDYVIRLNVPQDTKIIVKDEIRGEITFESNTVDDQVLVKSDGFPTYHLAVVVDDHLMEITHVVRGEEWLTSTPKHWLLYEYFNWDKPLFFHTPVLRNPDKSKLSKRHGHTNVVWYQEEGFLPEAILNFLALMGWSHPEGKEYFILDEFTQIFDLKDLKPVGPIFDLKKLEWLNGEWIRNLSISELRNRVESFYSEKREVLSKLKEFGGNEDKVLALAQTRMKKLSDLDLLLAKSDYSFTNEQKELAQKLAHNLKSIEQWENEQLLSSIKKFSLENNSNMKTMYLLVSGKEQGLPLIDMMIIQGKEKVIQHLTTL